MHINKVPCLLLVLLCCELYSTIKVPVTWDESANSEVKYDPDEELPVDIIQLQNVQNKQPQYIQNTNPQKQPSIPNKYFEYTAQKPRFAADIAAFHGVANPHQHYKAYPVRPDTGKQKPNFGVHHLLDEDRPIYQPLQRFVNQNAELNRYVQPTSSGYEIFHPYKAEEPALQAIYKDPVLTKIRNDIHDSSSRLQSYEQQAGQPNISKNEYLESPENTDNKLFPHKNIPVRYENHKPERGPIYYKPPVRDSHRNIILNQKFRHPWNQQNVKIRPLHYRPLHKHIGHLRQHHAIKYDDERNEYPQIHAEDNEELPEGYDIFERGKEKYTKLRDNLDESVNRIVQKHRPANYKSLELQQKETDDEEDEDEFVPVKNYAQVRKTETYKHVPRKAAFDDAETFEEVLNAPRLREAVKSTKAQTVYSEEGYEDSAYDHAGEQKHASDQEGHGGFLKEHEKSSGLYKIPSVSGKYEDGRGSEYRDSKEHGEKWINNNKDDEEETEAEDYSEIEHDEVIDTDSSKRDNPEVVNRNKREDDIDTGTDTNDENENKNGNDDDDNFEINLNTKKNKANTTIVQHEVDKREVNFKVPEINLNSTFSIKNHIPKLVEPKKDTIKEKYPYYFKNLKGIHKNSPLRYAENLKLIPKKTNGGTEFYDSRSRLECSEVDEEVDPLPEKLKNGENPTEEDEDDKSETKGAKGFDTSKQLPRLEGLGNKIDCFKAKYFGENPLDSPFFKEDIISNPEPIVAPKLPTLQLKNTKGEKAQESKINNVVASSDYVSKTNIFDLLDKLRSDNNNSQELTNKSNPELQTSSLLSEQASNNTDQSNVYTDVLKNIKNSSRRSQENINISKSLLNTGSDNSNVTYNFFQNKEDVTKLPSKLRRKRATPFVYEPYKIIRDGQVQDSKKTTTSSNISPLIKQLQSSGVADRVSRSNKDDKQVKKTPNSRTYVDIGKKERSKPTNENSDTAFVDVSVDHRRGEPRYELRPTNHKTEYTPVENKRAISVLAYNSQRTTERSVGITTQIPSRGRQRFRTTVTTVRPEYVTQVIPKKVYIQNVAASNSIKKTVTTAPDSIIQNKANLEGDSGEEDDGEYYIDDDEDEDDEEAKAEVITTTTTTTTTVRPSFKQRIKVSTTTEKIPEHNTEAEAQLLKLVTRFRNYQPTEKIERKVEEKPALVENESLEDSDILVPKYREKKKKSHNSTIVTDSKKYGNYEYEDEMRKEVDELIGIKHDMNDYMPMYEKEEKNKDTKYYQNKQEENDESEEDGDNNDNADDDEEEEEDDDYTNSSNDDDDDDDEDSINNNEEHSEPEPRPTTPEPTKRTLVRTTDAPPTTMATRLQTTTPIVSSRNVKPEARPVVTRKKVEIHKELPVNKSSPHVTQFKQDIKEIEIIKETPIISKRKPQKNVEVLDLYKDDNLAKDINKLGDVEIFRENLNLDSGPKHGGNYRKATKEDLVLLKPQDNATKHPKDAETSQSETSKHVELDEYAPKRLHGGNLKSLSNLKRSRNNGRSSKLIELRDPLSRMHGGNLKYDKDNRGSRKSDKLVELDEDHDDDHSSHQSKGYKPPNTRNEPMHGGNYRSAKLVTPKENSDDILVKKSAKDSTNNAALLLSSFAQAAPILTTTPGYIVDPSKRMYYYVES